MVVKLGVGWAGILALLGFGGWGLGWGWAVRLGRGGWAGAARGLGVLGGAVSCGAPISHKLGIRVLPFP